MSGTESSLRKVLVTGATSGIGDAVVRSMRASGRDVLAIGRRADRLESLAVDTGCLWAALDVRDNAAMRREIDRFAPDVVVNNAGVGHGITGLEGLDAETVQEAFDVNVVAPVQITSAALVGMRERGTGHIVNIGSIAGLHTMVSAVYGGTKAAVHQFSQNLRVELRGTGIRVSEICPGRVSSEFYAVAVGDGDRLAAMGDSGIVELRPADVADAVRFVVDAPPHVDITMIEMLPTEQSVGGVDATPTEPVDRTTTSTEDDH